MSWKRRDALTPSERRVAALAVAGRSNREIAQALFITVATVETHLRRVDRKLAVDGRAGLADAMSRDDDRAGAASRRPCPSRALTPPARWPARARARRGGGGGRGPR